MVVDLSLYSLSSQGKASGNQDDPDSTEGSWTWNPSKVQEDDDSWEVKAFAEDTSNAMGTTWPPRSYTCTFCRREFRSAQALGGHMNVHRKDRARLNQSQSNPYYGPMSAASSSSPALIIPTNQEFTPSGGLCLMYQLPHADSILAPIKMNGPSVNPSSPPSSTFVSISSYPSNSTPYPPNTNFGRQPYPPGTVNRSTQWNPCEVESTAYKGKNDCFSSVNIKDCNEELDLELRLGK